MASTQYTGLDLRAVIRLSVIILLDDDQGNRLDLLISGKALFALVTHSSAADRIMILCRSGINYSRICMVAKGTFHRLFLRKSVNDDRLC
jgi:hypothetical protein